MEDLKIQNTQNEILLTDKAVAEIRDIMKTNEIPDEYGLRIGVKGGGCSGLTYTLGFDNEVRNGDKILNINDIRLMVDWKSILYLKGTTIDFSDGLSGKGFVFNNPGAKRTCGCGSSFGV